MPVGPSPRATRRAGHRSTRIARAIGVSVVAGLLAGCTQVAPDPTGSTPTESFKIAASAAPSHPGSVLGAFAPGVPKRIQALPEGARLLVTSALNESRDKVTVSVSFTCQADAASVVKFYQRLARSHGFTQVGADASTVAPTATFAKDASGEYFTVTAVAGSPTSVSVTGAFEPDLD